MMNNFNLLSFQVISHKIRSFLCAASLITGNGASTGSNVPVSCYYKRLFSKFAFCNNIVVYSLLYY